MTAAACRKGPPRCSIDSANPGPYYLDTVANDGRLQIQNRKYLGSKHRLMDFIDEVIRDRVSDIEVFIDGFAGTGAVAHHFLAHAKRLIVNDLLYSNYVVNRAFLGSTAENCNLALVEELIGRLSSLEPREGYVYSSYGGTYFTPENAALIDAVREAIDAYHLQGLCGEQERLVLLTSLIYAADKVSNTVGQYDAFLKALGQEPYDENGRHRVDASIYKRLELKLPAVARNDKCDIYNEDLNRLIERIEGDVLYLDPPYNGRQYADLYHVLENIATWQKPALKGKTRKFDRRHLRSYYSRRGTCLDAFENLILKARARHIFMSYNSEGIMPDDRIMEILQRRGSVEVFRRAYPIFGGGAGKAVKRPIEERLFHCRVSEAAAKRTFPANPRDAAVSRPPSAAAQPPIDTQLELFDPSGPAATGKPASAAEAGQASPSDDKQEMFNDDGTSRGFYSRRNRLNDLTGREWVYWTKSVITNAYPPDLQHKLRSQHGAQKPPQLCADLIKVFSKRGQCVLDPFAGVGGVLIGATLAGRNAVGIEIDSRWVDIYRQVCERENLKQQEMIHGDSRIELGRLAGRGFRADMILTDVPYWQMDKVPKSKGRYKRVGEQAKENRKSKLGAFNRMSYDTKQDWLGQMRGIFSEALPLLVPGGYAAVFIGDMYNGGRYHFLSADLASLLGDLGLTMKANVVWYDGSKSLHVYGYLYQYIPSMIHQSILVFRKTE